MAKKVFGKILEQIKDNDELQEILAKALYDFKFYCEYFHPDVIFQEFSVLHEQILNLLNNDDYKKIAIAAPRGIGKTTLIQLLCCHGIVFRKYHYIIYISNTSTLSIKYSENIKRILQSNKNIKKYFGNVKVSSADDTNNLFAKETWIAYGDICIEPKGVGQQIRGSLWNGYRPDLIILDDLENKETVLSDYQRKKMSEWFFSDVRRTESRYGEKTKFIVIDTIKHQDSLLANLVENDKWKSLVLSICDDNFNSYDPNYMTTEELKEEYEESKNADEEDTFYMELMNQPISLRDATFKSSYFRYYTEGLRKLLINHDGFIEEIDTRDLRTFVIGDPAKTRNKNSKDSAAVVVSVDIDRNKIFLREIMSGKFTPQEFIKKLFDLAIIFNAMTLAVEVTSLHEYISHPIKDYMLKIGKFINYVELKSSLNKFERIKSLEIYYQTGLIYHNNKSSQCNKFENQLKFFPKSKLLDIADAFSYIIKLMEDDNIYLSSINEGNSIESEYKELELMDREDRMDDFSVFDNAIKGNWRVI